MDEKRYFQSYDGATLMYRRWLPAQQEQGIPIVLLHGAASNSTRWWHFVEHSRLIQDRILLRPDLRGNGESMWRSAAGIDHWVQDIAEMLRHSHQARAIILGHCLGANIAVHFAARYPNMCAGLILVEPMDATAITGFLARIKPFAPLFRFIVKILNLLNRLGIYRRHLNTVDLKCLDLPVHQAATENKEQALSNHGSLWRDLSVTPAAQYINNFIATLRPLPIAAITRPSLIIQSSGNSMTDAAKTKDLFGTSPLMEFFELESEHWIPTTHPERLCEKVDDWIFRNQKYFYTA
ncbi:Pimeloyl-ACP methyl ester carboxylesterase [Nitrosomonas aestuarii]|uniref:Pimeloyl-ACP methyl ester carboxylesterase n=1 Tax=Nitrosomonas aestuarii TaxID=52441 RepID=A0A1I3Y9X3_9PROT|nr:alpha/beta hydrolase [Nitrosomonas aestuarii]SFK28006.1 Pimeloyl-ACP methyl ester carboxylesterase [Nitrosomonas aestuarii]